MRDWIRNVRMAIVTTAQGMYRTLWYFLQTYRRQAFTQYFEYPELPVPVKPRYRGFHRFDLTTCIGCDKCARACPVDCIYIDKIKNPVGKGFRVNGFKIDYTKCMFCALCVDPCPVDCIFMGSTYDQSCFSRDGCIVDFAKLPVEVAWGQATLNPTAVAASKLASRAGLDQAARPAAAGEASGGRRSRAGPRTEPAASPERDRREERLPQSPALGQLCHRLAISTLGLVRCGTAGAIEPMAATEATARARNTSRVAEANATLPLVRAIVRDITELAAGPARPPRTPDPRRSRRARRA